MSVTAIRLQNRARSSSTLPSPAAATTSTASLALSSPADKGSNNLGVSGTDTTTYTTGNSAMTTTTATTFKPRRPSLPILSASSSSIPTQRTACRPNSPSPAAHQHQLLQPVKETTIPRLRSPRSMPRLSAERNENGALTPSCIARPSSALSIRSSSCSSASSSPRLATTARFGEATTTTTTTAIPRSGLSSLGSGPSSGGKTMKGFGIKPPSIVTAAAAMKKISSLPPIAPSPNSAALQTPQTASLSAFPSAHPLTTSAVLAAAAPLSPSSMDGSSSASSILARSKNRPHAGIDSGCFMTRSGSQESSSSSSSCTSATSSVATTPIITEVQTMPTTATITTSLATTHYNSSIAATIPTPTSGTTTMATATAPKSGSNSGNSGRLSATSFQRKPMSRRPSCADLTPGPSITTSNSTSAPNLARTSAPSVMTTTPTVNNTAKIQVSKTGIAMPSFSNLMTPMTVRPRGKSFSSFSSSLPSSLPTPTIGSTTTTESSKTTTTTTTNVQNTKTNEQMRPSTPPASDTIPEVSEKTSMTSITTNNRTNETSSPTVRCMCPPPLEFPENVKREMRVLEEEHRQRECGLYSKIIELQIENANLQGEKESLNRLLSRRDKTLLEVQIQLQAMEFFCRENNIKMDIDVCPDEAIENWCFKESDKVYERILITAQDLLRNGSRCLIGEPVMTRSSSQQLRSTRSSTMTSYSTAMDRASMSSSGFRGHNVVAGLSENVQPLAVQDQEVDPLLFKETSRPGTLKFDLQTLLRSEQEFNSNQQQRPSSTLSSKRDMDQLIAQLDVASNAEPDRGGRRALDGDDDREKFFRAYRESDQFRLSKEVEVHSAGDGNEDIHDVDDDDAYDDDDEEGQDSEFEELGEDMIKFVELQSSVAPRRDSRSMSFSSRMSNPLQPSNAKPTASSPDLSTAVLVKNLWSSGGARRNSSAAMTPMRQNSQPGTFLSSLSQSSLPTSLASVLPPPQAPLPPPPSPPSSGTPVGLGLGFMSMGRSTAGPLPLEKFMSVAPTGAPPMPH